MSVRVKFLGNLKDLIDGGETSVSSDNVREMLEDLTNYNPQLSNKIFEGPENKELKGNLNLYVNGRRIDSIRGLDTELKDGDKVVFFPPVGGG